MNAFTKRLIPVEVEQPVIIPATTPSEQPRTIMIKVQGMKDTQSGEIYLGVEAAEALDKAKARYMGVLSAAQLVELRKRLGMTQKEIADIFQIGEKTWSRWENGREVVSRSLNVWLKAVYDGTISVPWLYAKTSESIKLEPQLRIKGGVWLNTHAACHMAFSTWWPSTSAHQIDPAALADNILFSYRPHLESDGVCVIRGPKAPLRYDGYPRTAGNYEEMPLGA